jgi:hypothetical protein
LAFYSKKINSKVLVWERVWWYLSGMHSISKQRVFFEMHLYQNYRYELLQFCFANSIKNFILVEIKKHIEKYGK